MRLLQGALDLRRTAVGNEHPLVVQAINLLALDMQRKGQLEGALARYSEALKIAQVVADKTPEEEPAVAVVLNNMGVLCNKMGQLRRAQESHERALDIRVRLRGLHLDTAESVYNLASVYAHSGDKKSARLLFLRAGELTASLRGADDADALDALAKADKCS